MTISAWTSLVNIWDYNVYWANIVQIAIVCAILLVSNAIRRKVKFIRNSLMPTAIIGGFLGLGIKYLLMGIADWTNIPEIAILTNDFLGVITYHALALGFIAIGLKEVEKNKETGKAIGRPIKSGLFIVCNYVLQGILGLVITIGLSFVFTKVAPYAGVLLPMGYGQGPGQAFNIGTIFQTAGFEGGQSYGLMIATMGFVSASVGGVIYLNVMAKKGKLKRKNNEGMSESQEGGYVEATNEIPLVESVDKLTIQVALVGVTYLLTWVILTALTLAIDNSGVNFLINSVKPLLWGFNFIFSIAMANLVKFIIKRLKKRKLMNRTYTNNYMLNRVSGVAFDFMIIASIMAIDVQAISNWGSIISLIIICVLGAVVTMWYDSYVSKRVYKGYEQEAFLVFYGTMTGTASTGIALLREIDPEFKTPAATEIVTGSSTAIMFGFPLFLITGVIFNGWWWIIGSLALLIVMFIVFHFFLLHEPKNKTAKPVAQKE